MIEPLICCDPVQSPLAVQEDAEVADQVNVALWPGRAVAGATARFTTGTAVGVDWDETDRGLVAHPEKRIDEVMRRTGENTAKLLMIARTYMGTPRE